MSYEMNPDDVFGLASFLGIETKQMDDELSFKQCPSCRGGNHGDEYTFCINLKSGAANCVRSSCGYHGHFVEVCRDFEYPLNLEPMREYKKLPQPKEPIKPKAAAIEYLASRGIRESTAAYFEITVLKNKENVLVFPFYDENGKLVSIKYRNTKFKKGDTGSKEWFEKDTMPILFGMKQCVSFDRLIITEGQLDSLSVYEAGFMNAVSVPTGASGFTWWIPCQEWIEKFEEIIVFGDYEHGKITLVDGIKARYSGKLKVVRKKDYLGEKDANDILRKYGKEAIRQCIENAEVPVIENVKDLSTVTAINPNDLHYISTGFASLDSALRGGLAYSTLTIVAGKRGEGKSTFMSQIICSALNCGETVFAYSGELSESTFKIWLDFQLAGKKNLKVSTDRYGNEVGELPESVSEQINNWYRGRAYIFDNSCVSDELEDLPTTIERVIKEYGVTFVCIDNLMTAMEEVNNADGLNLAQGNFVTRLKKIAMMYDVAVLLVAHTNKSNRNDKKSKSDKEFDNDTISGASEITNRADNILYYALAKDEEYSSTCQLSKNRLFGRRLVGEDAVKLHYGSVTKRIYEQGKRYDYGWKTKDVETNTLEELPF